MVFYSISFNRDEVLLINPSANVFVFGDFYAHHKDWLAYSGGTDRPGEPSYNFSISNDSTMAFPPLGISDHVVVSVSIDFPSNSQWDAPFQCIGYDYSRADWDGCCDHLRDVLWENIFKLGASAAAREFCEWVQVGIDVYIPHRKYQVKSHSSPWFSAACAAVNRNHFFCLYQKDKCSDSKLKFRQASNHCRGVLEAAKIAYANKTKESVTSQKLGFCDF